MKYSWHDDVYKKALKNIGLFAEPHVYAGVDFNGWTKWFEATHPEIYKKFSGLETRMDSLWNQTGEKAMSEFKELCKQLEDAHRWAIREFVRRGTHD